jgi:hypothetical protein
MELTELNKGDEVEKLPMVKEGILACELLPLKSYTGFASLFAQPS